MSTQMAAYAAAGLVGIVSHVSLFVRGEWHLSGPRILQFFTLALLSSTVGTSIYADFSWNHALSFSAEMLLSYVIGLFSSIIIYRVFFHSLRAYPGPKLAAATKFWHVWQCRSSKNFMVLEELRSKYGNYVRTGPNELTVFDPAIMPATASNRVAPLSKPDWYDFLHPFKGVNALRDPKEHDMRRRIWDQGFTSKALLDYEERVHIYGDQLDQQIQARAGTPMNMQNWFYFLTFDIMGDLTFGKSFNMLKEAKWHAGPSVIRRGLRILAIATPVPWLAHLAFSMPVIPVVIDWFKMVSYCRETMLERFEMKTGVRDIAAALIEGSTRQGTFSQDQEYIFGDAIALVIAGSDTTAATLVRLFYRLCLHPDVATILISEIRSTTTVTDQRILKDLPYLNACINETLRLHPAVPSGGLRQAPPEGVTVAGNYIPGGTNLCIPQHSMHRSPEAFIHANDFIPERWIDRPELIQNKAAYAPFALGRWNCVGKHLGLAELRYIIALLLSKYDFRAADPTQLHKVETEMRDTFTALPGKLELVFEPVKDAAMQG